MGKFAAPGRGETEQAMPTKPVIPGRQSLRLAVIAVALGVLLAGCGGPDLARTRTGAHQPAAAGKAYNAAPTNVPYRLGKPYTVRGVRYVPHDDPRYDRTGMASWYGGKFHGRKTASGQRYDMNAYTAAHTTLPMGTQVRVTNIANGRSVIVTINDRGPFAHRRIIDLSRAAAKYLGFISQGTARVRVTFYRPARRG